MLNAETKARIALFNRAPKPDDDPSKPYPAMTGVIENKEFKKNVSAFLKTSKTDGKQFLSLVIKNQNDEQTFSGSLFRDEKDGKEGHYYGYISEQFVEVIDGEKEYTNSDWTIAISAKRTVSDNGKRYIAGDVYPTKSRSGTSASSEEDDLAF